MIKQPRAFEERRQAARIPVGRLEMEKALSAHLATVRGAHPPAPNLAAGSLTGASEP